MDYFEDENSNEFIKVEGNKHPDINKKIWKVIKKLDIENLIKRTGGFFCGGTILTLFAEDRVVSEIDLFFNNFDKLVAFSQEFATYEGNELIEETEAYVHYRLKTKNIKLFKQFLGSPEEVLSEFDFTVCQVAYVPKMNCFIMNENFTEDVRRKELVVNLSNPFPLGTINRVAKYVKRGYWISDVQSMLLALSINKFHLNVDPDELIEVVGDLRHLRGVSSNEALDEKVEEHNNQFST